MRYEKPTKAEIVVETQRAAESIIEALDAYKNCIVAKEQKLDNLKVYLNANGFGGLGAIDTDYLEERVKAFGFPVEIRRTNSDIGLWAVGNASHYKVADEELLKQ